MGNQLTAAIADSERSYLAAKASVGQMSEALLAQGRQGMTPLTGRRDLRHAKEQERAYKGWVFASIRPIAQRIAAQPVRVGYRRERGGITAARPEPMQRHPLLSLIENPNDLMVSWHLKYLSVASLSLTGRCLWWVPKGLQIFPIPTSWIEGFEGTTSFQSFLIRPEGHTGDPIHLPAEECVYFHYPSPCDPWGVQSPLQATAGAVDADEHIITSQISSFRRGIHPSHAVIVGDEPHPQYATGQAGRPRLTPAQHRQIVSAIRKRYEGVYKHGEPLILDGLIGDIKKLSHMPAEMDWLNSGKTMRERIALTFGVNEIVMGRVEGANRASSFVADRHFIDYTVNPIIELMSQCLTEWLRPMAGNQIEVWIEPCKANDAEMNLKWALALARHSAITGDEMRQLSPFALPAEGFADPVSPGRGSREAKASVAVAKQVSEMVDQLKRPLRSKPVRVDGVAERNGHAH